MDKSTGLPIWVYIAFTVIMLLVFVAILRTHTTDGKGNPINRKRTFWGRKKKDDK